MSSVIMSICLNCKDIHLSEALTSGQYSIGDIVHDHHVETRIDCLTGQEFIPVARVVNSANPFGSPVEQRLSRLSKLVPLWPEDYSCFEPIGFVD